MRYVPFADISEHQGRIAPDVMAAAGLSDCVVRAHSGGRKDLRVDEYIPALRGAGIGVPMLYGFCNPKSAMSAKAQGRAVAELCRQYNVHTAMADCEWYTGEPGSNPVLRGLTYATWLATYIDACEQQTQSSVTIYTSAAFWNDWAGGSSLFAGHDVILAGYPGQARGGAFDGLPRGVDPTSWADVAFGKDSDGPTLPRGFASWAGWQFSAGGNGQGPVYGCSSGDLDLNIADRVALARWYGADDPVITNEEDDLPYSEDQLRQMIREEAWAAVIGVLRSPEVRGIIHEAAAAGASGPSTESP